MQRQVLNEAENDMKDIIEVFHEIAVVKRFKTPIFVTEGAKFPPLDAAGVNVTPLQLEFVNLKKDYSDYNELQEAAKDFEILKFPNR